MGHLRAAFRGGYMNFYYGGQSIASTNSATRSILCGIWMLSQYMLCIIFGSGHELQFLGR
jgi:hypothetical protein